MAVPLSKLDVFKDLLEENMFRLTDRRHMSDLVHEQADIEAEISGKPVSVVFDGTTRLGEAMVIVVRFVMSPLPYSNDLFVFSCS